MHSITEQFQNAMLEAGMVTRHPIIDDGRLHRIHVEGDKRGTLNGAYILYSDGKPSGWFQHFSTGLTGRWSASGKREPFTSAMRRQIEADRKQRQIEQEDRQREAAFKARSIWLSSKPATPHPYLTKKRIKPHNARVYNDALVIPLYSPNRELVNLQFIDADGNKRFLSGGKKKGCFSVIGKPTGTILICEGFATGASLHEDTGHFVVVAMDCGNLLSVAREIKKLYPTNQIIVCGDNDESGVGQLKAKAAAMAVFGKVLIPETVGFDWNDELTKGGE